MMSKTELPLRGLPVSAGLEAGRFLAFLSFCCLSTAFLPFFGWSLFLARGGVLFFSAGSGAGAAGAGTGSGLSSKASKLKSKSSSSSNWKREWSNLSAIGSAAGALSGNGAGGIGVGWGSVLMGFAGAAAAVCGSSYAVSLIGILRARGRISL